MTDQVIHPDLLAFLEGVTTPQTQEEARAHIAECPRCREELKYLRRTLMVIDQVAQKMQAAFPDPKERGREFDALIDPDLAEEEAFSLLPEEIVPELPSRLKKGLSQQEDETVSARLKKSLSALTGLGKEAVERLSDSILSGEEQPDAAPAIRDDATNVEDKEDEPGRDEKDEKN
ncbi:anti-sigma factor family protein [Dethiosulfatarculus sandiegensis]|uniref:Putative zinc-finger domain-containing protein n=1 Tax=Dethiosulfatarculus sandiegensis TaxID=1429043 RepID=A0A0D2J677_9BACT|nr:zf-HC2 domain-containing protein [Dethiosulfatarculus sandiegensis]KIX11211.1 hypothetical protein X474_25445 [Dethiosulfatarculus sandiegensis]